MINNRDVISQLVEQGHLAQSDLEQALSLSQVYPPTKAWHTFISQLLLWFGVLSLSCAVIFFVAANWQDMGRFAKFGLVQVLIILSIFAYLRFDKNPLHGQMALTLAFLCLGALMAYFGQTYQTGADPWQLFFNWAVLSLPWIIIARFAPLWILWLVLVNLSIALYHDQLGSILSMGISRDESLSWCLLLLNFTSLLVWELCKSKHSWLNQNWATRLLAMSSISSASGLALMSIFSHDSTGLGALVWLVLMALAYVVYRLKQPDLFMLSLCCLSAIGVIISWVANAIENVADDSLFFILFTLTIGLTSAAAIWLKKLVKELQ